MNIPAASFGVSRTPYHLSPQVVTPNTFIGGPVPNPPVVSSVEPLLKACGNDGLRMGDLLNAAAGNRSEGIEL
jgi:hypothetical protein